MARSFLNLAQPSISSINTVKQFSEKELWTRLPDFGPLHITDYDSFLRTLRALFNQRWNLSQTRGSTVSPQDYKKLQLLGTGAFGYVVLARHKQSKKLYAMKCLDQEEVMKCGQVENTRTELMLLRSIDHPFTIYLVASSRDTVYVYMVLPLIQSGDLYGLLERKGLGGNEDHARFYASQVILALEYLQYLDFIYRDLKPENILVDHTGYIKLADFGFAKRLKLRLRTYTLCGTPEYLAPEIVLNKGHGKSVDWWATGCLIFELVAGRSPFADVEMNRVYEKIVSGKYKTPKSFSPALKDLVKKLLEPDLTKRFGNLKNGAEDIKQHKWMDKVDWLAIFNRTVEPPTRPRMRSLDLYGSFKLPKEGKEGKCNKEFLDF